MIQLTSQISLVIIKHCGTAVLFKEEIPIYLVIPPMLLSILYRSNVYK